jgi:hypothetical protein
MKPEPSLNSGFVFPLMNAKQTKARHSLESDSSHFDTFGVLAISN